ncbi:MAG: transposase, partial [Elusimicrobiota bacterium]|nr:transposase [Elusimicrobiota bacterium]
MEGIGQKDAAERFGYTHLTFQTIVKNFKSGNMIFFPIIKKGPKDRRTPIEIRDKIVYWRKKNLSSPEIQEKLKDADISIGVRTIERILRDEGFEKLLRRTNKERGLTKARTQRPEKSKQLNFDKLTDASFDCQVAGVYLFIPFIIKSELDKLITESSLPKTEQLSKLNNVLSILTLKLIGQKRLCQIINYSFDRGFGLFAGLNVLPKPTAISTYSYLIDKKTVMDFQKKFVSHLNKLNPQYYDGKTVNLDFHTIPHYGKEPPLDYNWVGSKNKPMKGALTFFAQDGESKMISYTNADIQRNKSSYEILDFVDYWLNIKGVITQTLVFDSKLTNYRVLKELNESKIKFITLRRKGSELINTTLSLPRENWIDVKLSVPKRKYNRFLAYEHEVDFPKHDLTLRQIVIREHGRRDPTFVISNNFDFPLEDIVLSYARRWRIENKISELVNF